MKLHDIQRTLRAHVLGPLANAALEDSELSGIVMGDSMAPARRVQIYRNHYYITVIEALAATFPATRRLVGEMFFAQVARRFAAASPPAGPCLFEYGEDFPALLEALPETQVHPYLGDVARLEWALNLSRTAPDMPPLDPACLGRVECARQADLIFQFHPACRLFTSRFPVARIWAANQPNAAESEISLDEGACRLLIHRQDGAPVWRTLGDAEFAFLCALRAGRPLERAVAAANGAGFDLAGTLAFLIGCGAIIEFILPRTGNEG
ncbi:MAG: DUF2063 domain-containing protein [Alphaproteobacteria bacterium]